jgi:hypothetical protein
MYSKTSTAIFGSLAAIAVAMLFATGPLVASQAYAYGYHHYYHHHHHSSHHHYYHHHHSSHHHYSCTSYDYKHHYHNCYKDKH